MIHTRPGVPFPSANPDDFIQQLTGFRSPLKERDPALEQVLLKEVEVGGGQRKAQGSCPKELLSLR
jgi:hypothetical protein